MLAAVVLAFGLVEDPACGGEVKVNFQSRTQGSMEVPAGYLPDYGDAFGDRGNGWKYGWNRDITADSRDRNSANAVDQRYDTLLHLQKAADAIWEIELPNGAYTLFIVGGDPDNTDQVNNFDVEGVILTDPDGQDRFDDYNVIAVLTDGRLTIKPAPGASNCKIMFVDIMGVKLVKARNPIPVDGEKYLETWANLSWTPGEAAASHDVYVGESFEDVNSGAAGALGGNVASPFFIVGLGLPGDPYPGGLVPGTTYYWRIDEVNIADPNSPWKGDVWSFWIPPRKAYEPSPTDSANYVDTAPTLSWTPGLNAKLHYVHFGDNLDTISNATGGAPRGTATYTPAGPLAKGKTYYWRIDEFDGAATHKGDVWSFTTLGDIPVTDPNLVGWWKFEEGEGTRIIDFSGHGNHGTIVPGTGGTVQWAEGLFNLALQFLGDDRGHVDLPPRIVTPTKGSVLMWINTTQGNAANDDEGMLWYGTAAGGDGYTNTDNEMHLNIDDPGEGELDFYLGGGSGVTIDGPRVGGIGWIHVAATWDLTGGCKLYVNGVQVGSAAHTGLNTNLAIIRLGRPVATGSGNRYYDGLMDDVRLFNYAVTAAKVSEIMNKGEDPLRAGSPKPATGALAPINEATSLSWSRGEKASQHDVYFGLDKAAVANANASDTTGVYRGRQSATSYTPPEGVAWGGGPYYWRIDEVNTDGTITQGGTWNFSVANYLIVDDIESYNDLAETDPASNRIYRKWIDGFLTPTTNGAVVGNLDVPLTERTNVHGGAQAMPLSYDNNRKFSEATLTLTAGKDWTREGVANLSLWFRGVATNAAEKMYVVLNGTAVVYNNDTTLTQKTGWTPWVIPLQEFAGMGVNLSNVTSITIGFGTRGNTTVVGGTGQMYFDDIRLYRP